MTPTTATLPVKDLSDPTFEKAIGQASLFLKLVADPTRLRLLSALRQQEQCVCDLAALVKVSESAVSHQLRLLRTGRVVTYRKEGRKVYYRLLDEHVSSMLDNVLAHVLE